MDKQQTRIISVLNFKGGTGKTTLSTNEAFVLSKKGKRILLIDVDLQRNSTGLLEQEHTPTLSQVIRGEATVEDSIAYARENFDIIPADTNLDEAANYISSQGMKGYHTIKNLINPIKDKYDFIFFDLPANFTPLSEACLIASNEMLIPCMLEPFPIEGLITMMDKLTERFEQIGHSLSLTGIVPFKADFRLSMTEKYLNDLKQEYPDDTLPYIRTDANISKAQSRGQTVVEAYPNSDASHDFIKLADYILS